MTIKAGEYRKKRQQLDDLIAELQSENLDIDEAVGYYEQANKLIVELQTYLKHTQNKLKLVKKTNK